MVERRVPRDCGVPGRGPGGAIITRAEDIKKGDLIEGVLASGRMVAQVVGATKPAPEPEKAPES